MLSLISTAGFSINFFLSLALALLSAIVVPSSSSGFSFALFCLSLLFVFDLYPNRNHKFSMGRIDEKHNVPKPP